MASPPIDRRRARHFAAFFGGSVLCAAINNLILIVGDLLGLHYSLLLVVCHFTSSSLGYVYHCRVTFDQAMHLNGYARFVAGIWLGLPVSLALIALMVDWLDLAMVIAAPGMTVIMFGYHYLVARLAINRRIIVAK
jgi:hypothetical protein